MITKMICLKAAPKVDHLLEWRATDPKRPQTS